MSVALPTGRMLSHERMEVTVHPDYSALVPIYFAEADERLTTLRDAADMLLQAPADRPAWTLVRRTAHAIAGNSAMMGFTSVAETARKLECHAMTGEARDAGSDDVLTLDRGVEALRSLITCLRRTHGDEEQ